MLVSQWYGRYVNKNLGEKQINTVASYLCIHKAVCLKTKQLKAVAMSPQLVRPKFTHTS